VLKKEIIMDGTKEDAMNRDTFEMYCLEHGWAIRWFTNECSEAVLHLYKEHPSGENVGVYELFYKLEVGMNFDKIVRQMRQEEGLTDDVQGVFPFTMTGELPM
jgi:hypothetical protein